MKIFGSGLYFPSLFSTPVELSSPGHVISSLRACANQLRTPGSGEEHY